MPLICAWIFMRLKRCFIPDCSWEHEINSLSLLVMIETEVLSSWFNQKSISSPNRSCVQLSAVFVAPNILTAGTRYLLIVKTEFTLSWQFNRLLLWRSHYVNCLRIRNDQSVPIIILSNPMLLNAFILWT